MARSSETIRKEISEGLNSLRNETSQSTRFDQDEAQIDFVISLIQQEHEKFVRALHNHFGERLDLPLSGTILAEVSHPELFNKKDERANDA